MTNKSQITNPKSQIYYANNRTDLIAFIPPAARSILEVGCGIGATGAGIKKARGSRVAVVGIELQPEAASQAAQVLDRVFTGDAEKMDLPFKPGHFDCIIYGDVLEHLIDPWGLLAKHAALLKQGGVAVASVPNVAHYRVVRMLRRKDWAYGNSGIMDVTHLRFFTIKTIHELFEGAGFRVSRVEHIISASRVKKTLNRFLGGRLTDDITEQYLIAAEKL